MGRFSIDMPRPARLLLRIRPSLSPIGARALTSRSSAYQSQAAQSLPARKARAAGNQCERPMKGFDRPADRTCDVLIAGSGLAGLTAAIAFARAGFDVVSCGATERLAQGRTVALLHRSVAFLESLGLWTAIEPQAAAMGVLRIIDDTGSLFPPRPVEFQCSEIGLDAFGWNVENDRMADTLSAQAAHAPGLERIASPVTRYDLSGERAQALLEDVRVVASAIVIGADGRMSPARRAAGLSMRVLRYPQSALTGLLAHRLPHGGASTEFHTRTGPFTLVPLPPSDAAPHRSSFVWVMWDE